MALDLKGRTTTRTSVPFTVIGLLFASSAVAGMNAGGEAYLSRSPTSQVTDTAPAAVNNLYVRVDKITQFKLAEIDITWEPAGNGTGCLDHINTVYKTSSGTTCTYLNRGSAVPVI